MAIAEAILQTHREQELPRDHSHRTARRNCASGPELGEAPSVKGCLACVLDDTPEREYRTARSSTALRELSAAGSQVFTPAGKSQSGTASWPRQNLGTADQAATRILVVCTRVGQPDATPLVFCGSLSIA